MTRASRARALTLSLAAGVLAIAAFAPPAQAHDDATRDMAFAAENFLAALDDSQRARASFEFKDAERVNWHFVPRQRRGLSWNDMSAPQRHLATALVASGLSHSAYIKAATIMSLEEILRDLEQGRGPTRDPGGYYWSIFGKPGPDNTWGWRVEGHHLSINFTIADGHDVSASPSFFGSNPAEVRQGPRKGLRPLAREEDLAFDLLKSLTPEQRAKAVFSDKAPNDILTGASRKASPQSPEGVPASALNADQVAKLRELINEYARRARPEVADKDLAAIEEAGFGKVHFAWAGSDAPGKGHYYRVQGPTFLLEFANTQNDANHIHAVWREFNGDFGDDILAKHFREEDH